MFCLLSVYWNLVFFDTLDARGKELAYNPNKSVYSPLENTSVEGNNIISLTLSC